MTELPTPELPTSELPIPDPAAPDAPMLFPVPQLQAVTAYLRQHESEWRALGMGRVQVFGSVARGEAHEASDVDVLVEFAAPAGLFAQVRAIWLFERLLGRRTDVVTGSALKPPLRQGVLGDASDVLDTVLPTEVRPSPKRWRWRVQELLGLLSRLHDLTRPHDLASFSREQTAQDAACMNLLRLGEGTKFVPEELQAAHPELPWNELRGVRNLLAHDYFGVDVALLWYTLTVELPPLSRELEAVLDSRGESA
ncbi:HepT-like ribonuclease domain-containing protein [Deinococcus altitudinis]|uniref:HepT-like ribonuclease domain-containing protein n=1 Tax=Deinococcus altitudinis TaxID=468914 RepID=UPI0038918BC7